MLNGPLTIIVLTPLTTFPASPRGASVKTLTLLGYFHRVAAARKRPKSARKLDPRGFAMPADDRADTLNICAPDGYEHGYIASDAAGNLYVILVKPTEDGKAKTIVIKVDASLGLSYKDILVMNKIVSSDGDEEEWSHAFDLIPVGMDADDYTIDGGQGHDIIFTQKGGKVVSDSEDDVVEGEYDHMDSAPPPPAEDPSGADNEGDGDPDEPPDLP